VLALDLQIATLKKVSGKLSAFRAPTDRRLKRLKGQD